MSISNIETNPLGPDTVTEVDPDDGYDSAGDNGGGQETEWLTTAHRHMDPLATALSHLGVGRSRDVTQSPGYEGLLTDPEAPFAMRDVSTGTMERPERWIHDQALQVRQVLATNADNGQWNVASPVPVAIVPERRERLTLILQNIGAFTVYIGFNMAGKATPFTGFPMPAGSQLMVTVSSEVWASVDSTGNPAILAYLDQFRTDNGAE